MRSFSYGDRLTQRSFSGTVREARKYLIRRCASLLSALSRVPLWRDERSSSPLSKIKSKRNGLSGWTLRPLRTGGLKAGLRETRTPGAGKESSWARKGGTAVNANVTVKIEQMIWR